LDKPGLEMGFGSGSSRRPVLGYGSLLDRFLGFNSDAKIKKKKTKTDNPNTFNSDAEI
jgi:hypothetical protein